MAQSTAQLIYVGCRFANDFHACDSYMKRGASRSINDDLRALNNSHAQYYIPTGAEVIPFGNLASDNVHYHALIWTAGKGYWVIENPLSSIAAGSCATVRKRAQGRTQQSCDSPRCLLGPIHGSFHSSFSRSDLRKKIPGTSRSPISLSLAIIFDRYQPGSDRQSHHIDTFRGDVFSEISRSNVEFHRLHLTDTLHGLLGDAMGRHAHR